MNLWIDDIRLPPTDWLWAKTYQEAIDILQNQEIDEVSFDHNLGEDSFQIQYDSNLNEVKVERTGYDVLLFVVQMKYDNKPIPKSFAVHSANPVGVVRMKGVIDRYLKG